ncbi:MAG TPA: serine hydrolase domain-containing protein [Acidobacteriota bacterium]|nr:serine hydrolase domain-containing protein [Acidobacteriota bacterium]
MRTTFAERLEASATPGGALVVVEGGRTVLTLAGGVEELSSGTPVDVQKTRFYVASVTKTFTAAAVLQLVEKGKLDLHADVNAYLDNFQVPPFEDGTGISPPITLHHLLTHTAGFDEKVMGYVARTAREAVPTGLYLAQELPPRVRPAGRISSYSNHGFGLAGYLVEKASGIPFRDYLQSRILEPLQMSCSTAFYPPPAGVAGRQAAGYAWDPRQGALVAQPYDYRNIPGAGTVSASAGDMSHFLIALLNEGRFRDVRLLSPAGLERMHVPQFRHHPRLPGLAYGLYERRLRGLRLMQHAGGYLGSSALLVIIPELNLGYFSASNSASLDPHYRTLERLIEALTPSYETSSERSGAHGAPLGGAGRSTRPLTLSEAALQAEGGYSYTRYSHTTMEKIAVLDQQVRVSLDLQEQRLILQPRHGSPSRWTEIEPLLFRNDEDGQLLALSSDEDGRPDYLFTGLSGLPAAFQRNHWSLEAGLQIKFFAVLSLLFLVIAASSAVLVASARGRRWKTLLKWTPAALLGLLAVIYFVLLDAGFGNSFYRRSLLYGLTPEMQAFVLMGWVITALAVYNLLRMAQVWVGKAPRRERVLQTLAGLSGAAFVVFLLHWNLL